MRIRNKWKVGFVLLLVVFLIPLSFIVGLNNSRRGGLQVLLSCQVGDQDYDHGEIFSDPGPNKCIKYYCHDGLFALHEEGCEQDDSCFDVGHAIQIDCTHYKCKKLVERDGETSFKFVPIARQCKDKDGNCHDPSQTFSYVKDGRESDNCTCAISGDDINYKCNLT